jgi:PAS domain S-box-containing protein
MNDRGRRGEADGLERPDAVRQEFDAVADVVDGGVLRVGPDGRIVDADSTFQTRCSTSREETVGTSLAAVFGSEPARALRDALETEGQPHTIDGPVQVETADGTRRAFEVAVRAVPEADGTGGILVLRDSSERDGAANQSSALADAPAESSALDDATETASDRNDTPDGASTLDDASETPSALDSSPGDALRPDRGWSSHQAAVLSRLYEFAAVSDAPLEERIRGILSVVRDVAGTEYGTLARVEGDTYVFEVVDGEANGGAVTEGDTLSLSATNCERVVEQEETLVLRDIQSEAPDLAAREGNQELGLSCYLGAPVVLDDEVYGTVCVYGSDTCEFSERAVSLVELAAALVEYELTQERTEEGLREKRELVEATRRRYETLVQNFPNGAVGLVDQDLRYTAVGGELLDEAGVDPDDRVGRRVHDIYPDDLVEAIEPQLEAALDGETRSFDAEYHDRHLSAQTLPVRGADGDVDAGMLVVQDVTERTENRRKLEESEHRYRALVENLPDGGVGVYDEDLRYTLVAGTMWDSHELDAADLEGKSIWEALPDDTAADVEPVFEAALEGETGSVESTLGGRTYRVWATPLRDADGEITAGQSIALDVTEQTEREQYLEDAKAQMEAAAEAGAVGTWEWHVEEDRFVADTALARLFGVEPERAREGVSLSELTSSIHEDDREAVQAAIEEAVETCGEYEEEYRVYDADDELRWVVARGHVECDDQGNPETFPGAITDITEQKRVERELDRQRKQLETLFGVLPVGVVVAESDGELIEANDVAEDIWGANVLEADTVEEYDQYDMWWEDTGEPVAAEEATMAKVLRGETVEDPDIIRLEPADGQERIVMVHGMPVLDDDGDVDRGVVTLTDITERRGYQRKLEESNERLEQFAYAASHDLQEPLRMVSSYLSLIENRYEDALDEDGEEFIEYAVDGADRMQEMIDALLQYSRVETEGADFEPVDLDAVFDDVVRDYELKIEETDADVSAGSLPTVPGDEDQLRQVLGNLLSNAIEYSGDEPPDVEVSAHRDGNVWVVAFEDEGIGIDPEHADRVFDVFQRLHSHDEHSGTGIGLALCERIIERHGGDIWVESAPGEGATFYFSVPDEGSADD